MKVKLLKKLRRKFNIEYFPSTKRFKLNGDYPHYFIKECDAKAQRDCDMINYARKHYEKYSKRIRIN